jgi:hypothetical protein
MSVEDNPNAVPLLPTVHCITWRKGKFEAGVTIETLFFCSPEMMIYGGQMSEKYESFIEVI